MTENPFPTGQSEDPADPPKPTISRPGHQPAPAQDGASSTPTPHRPWTDWLTRNGRSHDAAPTEAGPETPNGAHPPTAVPMPAAGHEERNSPQTAYQLPAPAQGYTAE